MISRRMAVAVAYQSVVAVKAPFGLFVEEHR